MYQVIYTPTGLPVFWGDYSECAFELEEYLEYFGPHYSMEELRR